MKKNISLLLFLPFLLSCSYIFFQPSRRLYENPASEGIPYETVKFKSSDGTPLTGLLFKPQGKPKGLIIHFHGNSQNMTSHFTYSAWLSEKGYEVFIFDYRGYGASGGSRSLKGAVMDGEAALKYARGIAGKVKTIVFGQSLGGALALAACGELGFSPGMFIFEGTFYSYREMASLTLKKTFISSLLSPVLSFSISDRYSPSFYAPLMKAPAVFIHSRQDPSVPFSQGEKLFQKYGGPKELWESPGGHIEAFSRFREEFGPKLTEKMERIPSEN